MTRISELGEFGFLQKLLPLLKRPDPRIAVPPGDDASVVDMPDASQTVITTDMLVEEFHFRRRWQTARQIGYKAAAANLSDLAAMGARPLWLLVSLGCPPDAAVEDLIELFQGMLALCDEAGVKIIGGDTCRADRLLVSVTAVGHCDSESVTTLAGAEPGQILLATACPGLSALGLRLLERFDRKACDRGYPAALKAHFEPKVPWNEGPEIARRIRPGAMTDVSDGLGRDVGKICQASGVGACIDFSRLKWHKELLQAKSDFDWSPLELALNGGEDYCLLLAASRKQFEEAREASPLLAAVSWIELGVVTPPEKGFVAVALDGEEIPISLSGFDHFSPRKPEGSAK